ncbi:MAG: LacI family transcriptional regulator [Hungatella sp.]|nr:LacI family transcriptional regulator [Hungatella sp.]
MSVTAKQIARQLNLSEAAVSMALNHKPGVSTQTRRRVLETARSLGYDFSRISSLRTAPGLIYFIYYNKLDIFTMPFFRELIRGVEETFDGSGYRLSHQHIYAVDDVEEQLERLSIHGCDGIILLGTQMTREDFAPFAFLDRPIVLLDTGISSVKADCIQINNMEGARTATDYLIKKRRRQPGYLRSVCPLHNFEERADGFFKAIRQNGMSPSHSVVHRLGSTVNAAYADMLAILGQKEPLASCYFADNDDLAIGAMKALKEQGYRIPQDISLIGFDNTPFSAYVDPPLTTVHVPKYYMGQLAAQRMLSVLKATEFHSVKVEVNTNLIIRKSV